MLRYVVVIAILAAPTAALSRPRITALPFAHVEAGPDPACVCRHVRRESLRSSRRRSGYRARRYSEYRLPGPGSRAEGFADGSAGSRMALGVGYAPWSRYDDCIWGYAGDVAPAHCTDYYGF